MLRAWLFVLVCLSLPSAFAQDAGSSANELLKQADSAYQAKQFSQSAALFSRAVPLVSDEDRAGVEYNLTCSQALAGDRAAAFMTLDHAVEDGYIDRKDTEADQDLVSLHADPRWALLLDRMTDSAAQQEKRWGDAAFATPGATNLADADKLAGLSELWAQAKYGFANFWHVPQLNWDQTYREFIPKVLATHSTAEYYRVLQQFYALLQDGHSNVYPPDLLNGSEDRLPLRTRLVDGHVLVTGARDPAADLQGLRPGDEIISIDSEPATEWATRNVTPYVGASSPQDRESRTYDRFLFLAPVGTAFTLGTRTPSGQQRTQVFTVATTHMPSPALFNMKMLPGNIAYVALNGFDDDTAAKEWDKHWAEISKATSLILDLRENGGGSDSVGTHILATLIDKPVESPLSRSTRWIATYRAWGDAETPLRFPISEIAPDTARHFAGPVVMLASVRTFSAGEDMVVVFAQAHRGKIIGEPTGGSSGQPLLFRLPGGGTARL
jgi:carboxyl-terminal processing protease